MPAPINERIAFATGALLEARRALAAAAGWEKRASTVARRNPGPVTEQRAADAASDWNLARNRVGQLETELETLEAEKESRP